ncbi:DUF7139 domain-containing protein [Haloplanus halophilus]|uniref:DUF7139 domain-containing protein n=1 Tax=Haloplanus halophilus TaxID=2949993 RepID=UPI00203FFC27|nr:hypothetical protein [Haloplanus sp. GDY1]
MTDYEGAGSTLDLMDFKNVRDGGVVETPTTYAMLMRVQPREWLILSEERRDSLYLSFMTFLRGLQFPTQILSMTTAYDPEPYLERFENLNRPLIGAGEGDADADSGLDESPLMDYGRQYHAEWLRNVVDVAEIRDREFFVAVSVAKDEEADDGVMAQLRAFLPGGNSIETDSETEAACIEEVNARAQRVASKLPQTQVKTEILDTRAAVLEVLYEVYHGEKPPISFTQGTYTLADDHAQDVADAAFDVTAAAKAEANEDGDFEFDRISDEYPEIEIESDADPLSPVGDGGYAHPDFVERVSNSRVLRWYARNIGPVGHGPRPVVPQAIYAGVFVGLLSFLLGAGALGAFVWSMDAAARGSDIYWLARTASFTTGAVSLPVFLLSLVVLFPSGRKTKALSLVGLGVVGYAMSLFLEAYPYEWDSNAAVTTLTVELYAAGLAALLLCVVLAVRSRQKVDLSNLVTTPIADGGEMDVDTLTDGGLAAVRTEDAPVVDIDTDADVESDAESRSESDVDATEAECEESAEMTDDAVADDSLTAADSDMADERNEADR